MEAAQAFSSSREAFERRLLPHAGVDVVGGAPGPSSPSPVFAPQPFAWQLPPLHRECDNTDRFFAWMAEQMCLLNVPWGQGGYVLSDARNGPALVVDCVHHSYSGFLDGMVHFENTVVGKEGQNIVVAVELKTAKRFDDEQAACEAQALLQLLSLVGVQGQAHTLSARPPLVFLTTGEGMRSRLLYSRGQEVVMSAILSLDAALLRVAAHIDVASSGKAGDALASAPSSTPPVAVAAGPGAAAPPALSALVVPSPPPPPLPQPPAPADPLLAPGIHEPAAQVVGAAASCQWATQAWEPIVESAPSVDSADEVAAAEVWLALEELEEVDEEDEEDSDDDDEEEEEEMTVEASFLSLLNPQSWVAGACSRGV